MNINKSKGLRYEIVAREYLQDQGLKFLEHNYHSRFGEIDLVMQDSDIICFVEVKFRGSRNFGGAVSAISNLKQQKIVKTAQVFMQQFQKFKNKGMRFDALILQQHDDDITIDWIPNAFYAETF